MSLITKPYTYTTGAIIVASEQNSNLDTIYSDYNGSIDNDNIKTAAGIIDSKLAKLTTAGKVSGTTFADLASIPGAAGTIPTANLPSDNLYSGVMTIWSGSTASVPSGYYLCDGNSGTPNLLASAVSSNYFYIMKS